MGETPCFRALGQARGEGERGMWNKALGESRGARSPSGYQATTVVTVGREDGSYSHFTDRKIEPRGEQTCLKPHSLDGPRYSVPPMQPPSSPSQTGPFVPVRALASPTGARRSRTTSELPGGEGREGPTAHAGGVAAGEALGGQAGAGDKHRPLHPGSSCSQICHNLSKSRNRSCPGRGRGGGLLGLVDPQRGQEGREKGVQR